MSVSNCCFLTCIQISEEAGKVVWYSHLFKNFLQFVVMNTVKNFGVVNKAEIDVFLELSCFFNDPVDIGNLISGSSAFSKSSLNIWKFVVNVPLKPDLGPISNPERWCGESAALNMPANLENLAVATGLEKVSFHSNP